MNEDLSIPKNLQILTLDIDEHKVLGRGSYGVVYVAHYYGTQVAAKKLHSIFFDNVSQSENYGILKSWKNELTIMSSLCHPNIVQFYGVCNSSDASSLVLSSSSYIVTELMVKSLKVKNLERPKLIFSQIIVYLLDIASGLCYLHDRPHPIMHRDLATKNILLSISGQAKIADLGVAKITAQQMESHTRHPGTDLYMPAEAIAFGGTYNVSIDIYSFGVITLELGIGRDPKATQGLKKVGKIYQPIEEAERRKEDLEDLSKGGNAELMDFTMKCLADDDDRITAVDALAALKNIKMSASYTSYQSVSEPPTSEKPKVNNTCLVEENQHVKKECDYLKNELDRLEKKFVEELQSFREVEAQYKQEIEQLNSKLQVKENELTELKKVLEAKHKESTKAPEMLAPRNPPQVTLPQSRSTSLEYKPAYSFMKSPHSQLVMPSNKPSLFTGSLLEKSTGQAQRSSSAIVVGSSTTGMQNSTVFNRSNSREDDHKSTSQGLASARLFSRSSNKPASSLLSSSHSDIERSLDSVLEALRNKIAYIQLVLQKVRSRQIDFSAMIICGRDLLKSLFADEQYIRSLQPTVVANKEVSILIQELQQYFVLLRRVNLHTIPEGHTDALGRSIRLLQASTD